MVGELSPADLGVVGRPRGAGALAGVEVLRGAALMGDAEGVRES